MAHSRQDDCVEGDREHGDDPSEPSEAHADIDQYLPSTHDALDTIATISLHYPDWYVGSLSLA